MQRFFSVLVVGLSLAAIVVLGADTPVAAARINVSCANATSDDTTINTAIAGSAAGDEIILDGPCLIDAPIKLLGDRTYRGESRAGTVIKQADGANLDAMVASDSYLDNTPWTGVPIALRSLTLNGNRAFNPTARDALVLRSWLSTVDDVQIVGARRHGIRLTNLSANGTALTNTQVNGRIANSFVTGSGQRGIYVEDTGNAVTDWQLVDNWVADSGTDGIRLDNAAGWFIERNHIYGVGGAALSVERLFATSISDNYIEDFATVGLAVTVQGDTASVVSGNRIFKFNGGGGTFLQIQVNYGSGVVAVTGNTIRGNGSGTGLSYQKGAGVGLTVASTGNAVTGVATPRVVGTGVTVNTGL